MNAICKSALSTMLLGLVVGCGGEPEPAPPAPAESTSKVNYPPAGKAGAGIKPPAGATPGAAPAPAKPADAKKGDEPPPVEGPKAENKGAKLTTEELAAIKQLPAAEQPAALAQAICPVSDHHLGSMDKPVKVSAEGRTFYICCEGCEDKVKSDPKGTIAKLDKK